jgi:hypothetical protein
MKTLFRFGKTNFSLLTILFVFLFSGSFCAYGQSEGIPAGIVSALEKGDAGQLSDHFNTTIDLNIPGHDAPCSKKQAGQILKRFFENHPVKQFKSDHQGNSHDGSLYMIGTLKTKTDKNFRVYVLLKKRDGVNLIQQLQFDEE